MKRLPAIFCRAMVEMPPARELRPVIVAMVLFGKRSLITLYWLAAQAE